MRSLIPLIQVVDMYGVVDDLVLNLKCMAIERDEESSVESYITPDELLAVQQWYTTAWAMHLQVSSRQRKEKPSIKVGNILEFVRDLQPHGTTKVVPAGTMCRVMFPPRKSGYGLAPETVRVRVGEEFLTVPTHYLTTLWSPIRPEDAGMTASRRWHGKQAVGKDISRMFSPLCIDCLRSYVDEARAESKVCAYVQPYAHQSSCTQPSPVSEHQSD